MTDVSGGFERVGSGSAQLFRGDKFDPDGIGLCLSGGGYKAAAYHVGALIRLNELGYLRKIGRIASVSGGSIAAGYLGLKWNSLQFDAAGVAQNLKTEFVEPLQEFLLEANLDVPHIAAGLLLPFRSGADGITRGYRKHLFGEATLQALPAEGQGPRFELLAVNYELNSLWRFGRDFARDYRVGEIRSPNFSLAQIVAASSAFPPFFCPLELDFDGQTVHPMDGADKHRGKYLQRAMLADGGIYDNLGLEPIWKRYGVLLVSNAGDDFEEDEDPRDWFSLMRRVIGMIHRQAENNRQRMLMALAAVKDRKVAYWPLRNDYKNFPVTCPVRPAQADVDAAQGEKVRLWSLGPKAYARLANHGYALCDSAMRSYVEPGAPPPTRLPY